VAKDLSELPLSSEAHLEGIVVRIPTVRRAIDRSALACADVCGKAVLVQTGWDSYWGTSDYFQGHPFLTRDAAQDLVAKGAALVGIDSLNIDETDDGARPVHSLLLVAEIPIVEHLCNLKALPERGFRFYAVPVKVNGFGTFPVRAFAIAE